MQPDKIMFNNYRLNTRRLISRALIVCLLFISSMISPALLTAQTVEPLKIYDVDTTDAPNIDIYFSLRAGSGLPITGLQLENCNVSLNNTIPPFTKAEIKSFKDGKKSIGVLFLFPTAKNYVEEIFGIRVFVYNAIQILRPLDYVGAVGYDSSARDYGWHTGTGGLSTIAKQITETQNSEVIEPDLFAALPVGARALKDLQGVSQKYLVIISDAEGAVVGDPAKATNEVRKFNDNMKENNITPIVIAYNPDGIDTITYKRWLTAIAQHGIYLEAGTTRDLNATGSKISDILYKQYIYSATIDLKQDFWLEEGRYPLDLNVKTNDGDFKASTRVLWPKLTKDRTWLWITIGSLAFFILLVIVVVIIIKKRARDEDEYFEPVQTEATCSTCGKIIPQLLYGYTGEFCLSGGLPDCPYYQMPDKGKIQITKGTMADTTFFIKQEITTIGSNKENSVYLNDPSVSRRHAAVRTDEGRRYEIRDFGSANGTYVNNDRTDRKFLRDGDLIRFGTVETVFKLK